VSDPTSALRFWRLVYTFDFQTTDGCQFPVTRFSLG